MDNPIHSLLAITAAAPLVSVVIAGCAVVFKERWLTETAVSRLIMTGLIISLICSVIVALSYMGVLGQRVSGEVEYESWVSVGEYRIQPVLLVDNFSIVFSLLGAILSAIVARFSRTYLHKEAGFVRFYVLLGLFATGTQLVSFAGELNLFFAGWEAIGIASAMFIGFFYERPEPVRSALRAFTTYRICDLAFLIAIVATYELIGSTRLSDISRAASLPTIEVTLVSVLLLVAAFGKSAQLPFSVWLVRAMEGPMPSSALVYGGVSIHAGLYLLLRTSPLLEAAPGAAMFGAAVGVLTAIYATAVGRTHADAKGALAQATLAQTGLILAEICLGLTTLALVHLVGHALLRVWQYLRTQNLLHDAHSHDHHGAHSHHESAANEKSPEFARRIYVGQLHRFRLDDRLDALVSPVMKLARMLHRLDERYLSATIGPRRDK